jgi:hypothetical protein
VDEFPQEAWTFLAEYVASLDELGILLALIESGERWWDVPSMAARSRGGMMDFADAFRFSGSGRRRR